MNAKGSAQYQKHRETASNHVDYARFPNPESVDDVCGVLTAFLGSVQSQNRTSLLESLQAIRQASRKFGNAMVPLFSETSVLPELVQLFLDPPDEVIERKVLDTIMCVMNACKDTRAVFAREDLLQKVITVIRGDEPEIHWLATCLTVCGAIIEYAEGNVRDFIREGLPLDLVAHLIEYVSKYDFLDPSMEIPKLNAKRRRIDSLKMNTLTSLIWLLRCYCESPVAAAEVPILLQIYMAMSVTKPLELELTPDQQKSDNRDIDINRMYRHLSGMMANLMESKSLPPGEYQELVKPFIFDKLTKRGDGEEEDRNFSTVQELLCELLEKAIMFECEPVDFPADQRIPGIELAISLIEDAATHPNVRHAAFHVILAYLRRDPIRVSIELIGPSNDLVPIRRIAYARRTDFECMASCADCFLELLKVSDIPTDRFSNSACLGSAIDFLTLESDAHVMCGLEIITRVCEHCIHRNSVTSLDIVDRKTSEIVYAHDQKLPIYHDLYELMHREGLAQLLDEIQTTDEHIISQIEKVRALLPQLETIYGADE